MAGINDNVAFERSPYANGTYTIKHVANTFRHTHTHTLTQVNDVNDVYDVSVAYPSPCGTSMVVVA